MVNKFFELERLKASLRSRGMEEEAIAIITQRAEAEIDNAIEAKMKAAMDEAVSRGVEKDSAEFINDLRINTAHYSIDTTSGSTDFSEPPFPMLPRLLQGAKPIKDGSGVYKVIPVGGPSKKPTQMANIFDAQKAIQAERAMSAKRQYNNVAPKGSVTFRTATSKQNPQEQWVLPAKEKDFSGDLKEINDNLLNELEDIVHGVIREYEEGW